jgi:VanZ family protein
MMLVTRIRLCRAATLFWLLAPLAWMAVIYWFSAQPALPQAPDPLMDLLLKKGAHMAAYAVLLVLWWRALSAAGRLRSTSPTAAVIIAWTLTVLYAASDEYHQRYVPGRHGRLTDATIDAVGASLAVLGLWLGVRLHARRLRLKP